MTIEEVSEYLKLPVDSLYKYARNGKIPAYKVGRYWRFDRDQIDQWVRHKRKDLQVDSQVLVIDPDAAVRASISNWGLERGSTVDLAHGADDGMSFLRIQQYDVVFMELDLPDERGLDILREIERLEMKTEVVVMTGNFNGDLFDKATKLTLFTVLKKPIARDNVEKILSELVPARPGMGTRYV